MTGSKWTLLFLFTAKGGIREMAVFRVEKNSGYTVMSNHH
ncbi:helix-turn-helix domain-containing protein, partial [Faecalibacterium prausnitzii]